MERRIGQEDKIYFIRGKKINNYNSTKVPWEEYRNSILSVVIEERVKLIMRRALQSARN